MAIKTAKELGVRLEKIAAQVRKIEPFRKTMELKKGMAGVTIIDDTYSANPQGVIAAIKHLNFFKGAKIIVMPCLIELGFASSEAHRLIGEEIGRVCDLAVVTTKDCFTHIKQGSLGQGMKKENIIFMEEPGKIFNRLRPFLKKENVILLESRVPQELFNILKCCPI
jgi:UDP-N-acetylmuramoyl-tripeptide--D-alanyl-D-alanine ligase